jgi:hypothetical protein
MYEQRKRPCSVVEATYANTIRNAWTLGDLGLVMGWDGREDGGWLRAAYETTTEVDSIAYDATPAMQESLQGACPHNREGRRSQSKLIRLR